MNKLAEKNILRGQSKRLPSIFLSRSVSGFARPCSISKDIDTLRFFLLEGNMESKKVRVLRRKIKRIEREIEAVKTATDFFRAITSAITNAQEGKAK